MSVKKSLDTILQKIDDAVLHCGRESGSVKLLAVSKRKPLEMLQEAYSAGQRLFGENRVQEAELKVPQMPDDAIFHMIGHLQSNKVNKACQFFSCIQSVDSLKLAKKIDNRCKSLDKIMDIYLEINISDDPNKTGYRVDETLLSDIEEILELNSVRVKGLMAIGAHVEDRAEIKNSFQRLQKLNDDLKERFQAYIGTELSMGMSGDYIEAIESGSTMVRVGSAIFGSRE